MTPRLALAALAPPLLVLTAAHVAASHLASMPPALDGVKLYGPDALLVVGATVAFAFRRGRALLALLVLAAAYGALHYLASDFQSGLAARTLYGAICITVPLNLGALSWLRERGIANAYGARRCMIVLVQIAFIALVISSRRSEVAAWLYARYGQAAWLGQTPVPQLAWALIALAAAASVAAWILRRSPIDFALGGAAAAFGIAAHDVAAHEQFGLYIAAAALMLTIAIVQDGLRMAFRDELTGLFSRRALNEQLAGLGHRYAIAMLDVDHFKRINDLHGHDVGDQVLRMIASRLARMRGGCSAYRYGGEEFALVFRGRSAAQALPHLEAVRKEIAAYALAIRGANRPRSDRTARRHRGTGWRERAVSVTVSIGVAEPNEEHRTPDAVVQAADRALYRAKRGGRNAVVG